VLVGLSGAGPSSNQGVGGSIPALVDVSLSKTLNPEMLLVAVSTVCEWEKKSQKTLKSAI